MATSKTIGGINVTITATIDKFRRTMTAAQKILRSFTTAIKNTIFSLKGLAVALAVGAFTKMTANAFEAVDAMGELADKVGVSTEKIKGLQIAASEAGISSETLERALVALNKAGLGGERGLRQWIENTSKLGTQQERLAAATKMFGTRGASMVRMLTGGTAALDEAQEAAERLGWSLSRSAVAGVERAMDAFGRLKTAIQGIFANLAVELAPFIEVLTGKLTDLVANGGAKTIGRGIADAIISMAKFVADAIQRMVVGVLSMVAEVKQLIYGVRTSQTMFKYFPGGLYANAGERDAAKASIGAMRGRASAMGGTPWSSAIDRLVANARQAASQAKGTAPGGDLLKRIGSRFADSIIQGASARFSSIGGPVGRLYAKAMLFGAMHPQIGSAAMGGIGGGSLSLAQSGSADAYRQQASIRRQGEDIQRKQLRKQEGMLTALQSIDRKTMPIFEAGLA